MRFILLALILSGCQVHMGMAFHPEEEIPEPNHNPLGVIRIYSENEQGTQVFCEHVSSIPDEDNGLDMCGAMWRVY